MTVGHTNDTDEDRQRRLAVQTAIPALSRLIAHPSSAFRIVDDLREDLRGCVADDLASRVVWDVAFGALLHAGTMYSLVAQKDAAKHETPLYVDGQAFRKRLHEPLHTLMNHLLSSRLGGIRTRFTDLHVDGAHSDDPLLTAAMASLPTTSVGASDRPDADSKERIRRVLKGSIIDNVTLSVHLVVGAERTIVDDDLPKTQRLIRDGTPSLRRPAAMTKSTVSTIWSYPEPYDQDGVFANVPIIERDGSTFRFPFARSPQSLCVGMFPITEGISAFGGRPGGFEAFCNLMSNGYRVIGTEGSVRYRLVDVEIASIRELAQEQWRQGQRIDPSDASSLNAPGGRCLQLDSGP